MNGSIKVEGLMPGVSLVRFGEPKEGEYFMDGGRIYRRDNSSAHLRFCPIVEPLPGYAFLLEENSRPWGEFRVIEVHEPPLKFSGTICLRNSDEVERFRAFRETVGPSEGSWS